MQCIVVKYLPATDYRPARLKAMASGGGGSLTVSRSPGGVDREPWEVARMLADRLKWDGEWIGADTRDGWVFVSNDARSPRFTVAKP